VRISDMSERQLIEVVLAIYSTDEKAVKEIAHHLAVKLAHRRTMIREQRKKAA